MKKKQLFQKVFALLVSIFIVHSHKQSQLLCSKNLQRLVFVLIGSHSVGPVVTGNQLFVTSGYAKFDEQPGKALLAFELEDEVIEAPIKVNF